ncbi:amidohydrolase [Novosphingobium sp. 9U]|uniref:amidohydrolase family protein n=1 Tax=Novosphingobium sp. 9U TaxID=2653158 RepID=UPI0012F0FC9B|nr:amidohydrolase family protein [Novosphingobium sp. 9U]VWX54138.1 Amidohydrolase [Novosphingobium sp. 9U]
MGLDVTGKFRYPPPRADWLSQRVEEVIDPALPIIDPHHHLWEEHGEPYLLDELCADASDGHDVRATVAVQAHYAYRQHGPASLAPVGETEAFMAVRAAARAGGCATRIAEGIVAHADLTLGELVNDVLEAHFDVASDALCGIRHSVSRDELFPNGIVLRPAPAGLLADAAYRQGLQALERQGLVYDAMLYHAQIPELTQMAQALPGLTIVLDHIGCILGVGPYEGREAELLTTWRKDMAALAQCPNVHVKVGGFGMIVCGPTWHERPLPPTSEELAEAWRPYVETCIELFGAQRCMFESNFPVDKAMYSYRTLWNAFKRLTGALTESERADLFAGTALRTYGLGPQLLAEGSLTAAKADARV